MNQPPLFALERRFERRVLAAFLVFLMALAITAIINRDWWLLGISIVAMFLNGVIGQGLHKNRGKSSSKLAAGSAGESETITATPDSVDFQIDFQIVARTATKFMFLVSITVAVVAYHLDQSWWVIIGAGIVGWAVSAILSLAAVWKARRS